MSDNTKPMSQSEAKHHRCEGVEVEHDEAGTPIRDSGPTACCPGCGMKLHEDEPHVCPEADDGDGEEYQRGFDAGVCHQALLTAYRMAAAHEMYEALQAVKAWVGDGGAVMQHGAIMQAITNALAKADLYGPAVKK